MVIETPPLPKIPVSTYRLHFNRQFTFSDAREVVHYLHELGITDIYASPYFRAKKGSLQGYDIVDHNTLNPEIGTDEEYEQWIAELRKYEMGQLSDIVPNHMCIESMDNVWWMDVLENGPGSIYAGFFDIDWKPVKRELENKVLLPFLGDQYGRVLENREINLTFEEGSFFASYYDHKFPLLPETYVDLLNHRKEELKNRLLPDHPHFVELLSIMTALNHLPSFTEKDPEKIAERYREKEIIKKRLFTLCNESPEIQAFINENIVTFNGRKGDPKSFDLLDALLSKQAWRLSHWRVATEEINYRRFFDVNGLAAIKMEDPVVFRETHRLTLKLIWQGKVSGLRVDHPDGLYNPSAYFTRLQQACFLRINLPAEENTHDDQPHLTSTLLERYKDLLASDPQYKPFYIVGEKILMKGEKVPEDWSVFGTVGYLFLNPVNGIFIDGRHAKAFQDIYTRFTRSRADYQDLVYEKKMLIMETTMSGEVNTLGRYLDRISETDRHTKDFTLNSLKTAIMETIACFPVYRTYVSYSGVNDRDRRYIQQAVSKAKRMNPALSDTLFGFLENILLLQYPEFVSDANKREWLDFVMKFQQVTGPVMAKGVEDTVFYIYNRFVSLNEVGGNPEKFGTPLDAFHGQNIERAKSWPYSLNTTSTHDTKRSEDVRARLNVLSELPHEWSQCLVKWSRMTRKKQTIIEGQRVPDRNTEYLFYQTLAGAWPVQPVSKEDEGLLIKRIKDYMVKAVREAKVNTSWISPNLPYEAGVLKSIDAILWRFPGNSFMKDFESFQEKVAYFGMFNSLSQTVLKIASPGVPDFYQGTELWDFSLVDPDNRRPVDFQIRKQKLEALKKRLATGGAATLDLARKLLHDWRDGSLKLYVTFRTLNFRRDHQGLFKDGTYVPLSVAGNHKHHVCAFARVKEGKAVLVIVPRFLTSLVGVEEAPLGRQIWGNTEILLPEEIPGNHFHNIFTGETIRMGEAGGLFLGDIFSNFPVALLQETNSGNMGGSHDAS